MPFDDPITAPKDGLPSTVSDTMLDGPRPIRPLWMPAGSVRALLGLCVAGAAYYQIATGRTLGTELFTALMLVLGYYFATRQAAPGVVPSKRSPLWLPRRSIRFLLIAGFVAACVLLIRARGDLLVLGDYPIIAQLGGFFAGRLVRLMIGAWFEGKRQGFANWFGHLKALVCLGAGALTVITACTSIAVPLEQQFVQALPSVVTFYYGSR